MLATIKLGAVMDSGRHAAAARGTCRIGSRVGAVRAIVADRTLAGHLDGLEGAPIRASRWAARRQGGATTSTAMPRTTATRAAGAHAGRCPDAAVLHLGNHGQTQIGRALTNLVRGGALVHGLLDWAAARRRAPELKFAGLGQARVVVLFCAVECRGHGAGLSIRPLQRRGAARPVGPLPGDHVLRAAHGVAHAHPGRSTPLARHTARGGRGG